MTLSFLFVSVHCSRLATDVLVSLLSMYTNPNSPQAKDDARKSIFDSIKETKTFLFDRLLQLPAVQQLKGDPIYEVCVLGLVDCLVL